MFYFSSLGFNLLLCSFAIGDKENMKKAFQKLVQVRVGYEDDEKYTAAPVSSNESDRLYKDQLLYFLFSLIGYLEIIFFFF